MLVVHPEFEEPLFSPQHVKIQVEENNDLVHYLTTVKANDNVDEELRYFIISGGIFSLFI